MVIFVCDLSTAGKPCLKNRISWTVAFNDHSCHYLSLLSAKDNMTKFFMLVIFCGLVAGVDSQSYPHFEFRGDVLVNNSFIVRGNPTNIGEGHNDSLHCVTDNSDCCTNGQGNWYDETGGEVQQGSDGDSNLYVTRGDGVVYLNRRTGGSSGMWRCDIPDSNGVQQSIYIYLGTPRTGVYSINLS